MALSRISLENFTVFNKIDIQLCDGINVFIGENGTGKTHLLKCLYAFCEFAMNDEGDVTSRHGFAETLKECFQDVSVDVLAHNFKNSDVVINEPLIKISVYNNSENIPFDLELNGICNPTGIPYSAHPYSEKSKIPAVFIPAKEMLTHSRLEKDFSQRKLPFDTTLIDILNKSGVSALRELPEEMREILVKITKIIGGTVVFENEEYYVEKTSGNKISFALEAEGFKKLGLIYRLIETGNIQKGSVLFWDEPESNINPRNIPAVVDILLALQKVGVQIFVATHDYVFTKYLEARKTKEHQIIYHALYLSGDSVLCESDGDFALLENNSIVKQYIDLYKEGDGLSCY